MLSHTSSSPFTNTDKSLSSREGKDHAIFLMVCAKYEFRTLATEKVEFEWKT